MRQRIVGGGHSVVEINGRVEGRFSAFEWESDQGEDEIRGVDSNLPFELADGPVSLRGSLAMWRVMGDGGAEGAGLTQPTAELPRSRYFSMRLLDRLGGHVMFEADQCRVRRQRWRVAPKQLVSGTIEFSGIGWSNEASG